MFETNCALFDGLSSVELEKIAQHSKLKVMAKQQYLCAQHAPMQYLYCISTGVAATERISSEGRRQVLSFLFPGDLIGVTKGEQYDYSVKCLRSLTAHQLPRSRLFELSKTIPSLEHNINGIRGVVVSQMLDQLYLLGQKKAHERICYLLTHLLGRMPGATVDHIELPMTRLDIADYLGLTVETVSRSITKLKQEGLIAITDINAIAILDLDAIEELADID